MTAALIPATSTEPPARIGRPSPTEPRPLGSGSKDPVEAAKQFEALLIGQMLTAAHTSASVDGENDSTGEPMWDVAAQQFAMLMAQRGGLGLANLISKSLNATP